MKNKRIVAALFLAFLLTPVTENLGAEARNTGRLADGRAYRVDSQGIELVDQVAELQVSIEELKRQLEASQNEVAEKTALLEKGSSAGACAPQPQFACPELEQSEKELKDSRDQLALMKDQLAKAKSDSERAIAVSKKEYEKSASTAGAKDKEISMLRAKLKVADEQIALYKNLQDAGPGSSARSIALSNPNRSSLRFSYGVAQPQAEDEQKARDQAINSFRKTLRAELAQTQELIKHRDALFNERSTKTGSLHVKPSAAVSSQSRSIEQLKRDIEAESSLKMLGVMSRELREIRSQVNDDIELAQRISKY